MTTEEKAKELIKKFRNCMTGPGIEANDRNAPGAAILCVNVILDDKEDALDVMNDERDINLVRVSMQYWQSVLEHLKTP